MTNPTCSYGACLIYNLKTELFNVKTELFNVKTECLKIYFSAPPSFPKTEVGESVAKDPAHEYPPVILNKLHKTKQKGKNKKKSKKIGWKLHSKRVRLKIHSKRVKIKTTLETSEG